MAKRRSSVKARRTSSGDDLPEPLFDVGQEVSGPIEVVESGRLKLVSREWGKENKFLNVAEWMYGVIDAAGPPTAPEFQVSQAELVVWNSK